MEKIAILFVMIISMAGLTACASANANEPAMALLLMFAGVIGTNIVLRELFGIPEHFSVFAATGFNAVLGSYLFHGFGEVGGG